MDRFEECLKSVFDYLLLNLHSSMDRFEAVEKLQKLLKRKIYIPVWIDLKTDICVASNAIMANLHSSMDRFEVETLSALSSSLIRFTFQYG